MLNKIVKILLCMAAFQSAQAEIIGGTQIGTLLADEANRATYIYYVKAQFSGMGSRFVGAFVEGKDLFCDARRTEAMVLSVIAHKATGGRTPIKLPDYQSGLYRSIDGRPPITGVSDYMCMSAEVAADSICSGLGGDLVMGVANDVNGFGDGGQAGAAYGGLVGNGVFWGLITLPIGIAGAKGGGPKGSVPKGLPGLREQLCGPGPKCSIRNTGKLDVDCFHATRGNRFTGLTPEQAYEIIMQEGLSPGKGRSPGGSPEIHFTYGRPYDPFMARGGEVLKPYVRVPISVLEELGGYIFMEGEQVCIRLPEGVSVPPEVLLPPSPEYPVWQKPGTKPKGGL